MWSRGCYHAMWLLLCTLLTSCAAPIEDFKRVPMNALTQAGFDTVALKPPIRAWVRDSSVDIKTTPWHLYIEGDGNAWLRGGVPSPNPTPRSPVALWLALEDTSHRVAYIARPCQWFTSLPDGCQPAIWTDERYGEQVQQWLLEAIQTIAGDQPVRLVGFSGGAHLALQLTPLLPEVEGVVSVAGNLDDKVFAEYHRLPTPRHVSKGIMEVPLWSLSGGADRTVPPELTERMLKAREGRCQSHLVLDRVEHAGPWQLNWSHIQDFLEDCASR